MTTQRSAALANRYAIAASTLLRHDLAPEFASDQASVAFVAGITLDQQALNYWSSIVKRTRMDVVHLGFEPERERFGPRTVCILAERDGLVHRWLDCSLWAPLDAGPLLIMPKGLNVCFAHDGRSLISMPTRPSHALKSGIARAHMRLARFARGLSEDELPKVACGSELAA